VVVKPVEKPSTATPYFYKKWKSEIHYRVFVVYTKKCKIVVRGRYQILKTCLNNIFLVLY